LGHGSDFGLLLEPDHRHAAQGWRRGSDRHLDFTKIDACKMIMAARGHYSFLELLSLLIDRTSISHECAAATRERIVEIL